MSAVLCPFVPFSDVRSNRRGQQQHPPPPPLHMFVGMAHASPYIMQSCISKTMRIFAVFTTVSSGVLCPYNLDDIAKAACVCVV